MRCSLPWEPPRGPFVPGVSGAESARAATEDDGPPPRPPRALTFRDVRREARLLADRLVVDCGKAREAALVAQRDEKMNARTVLAAMRSEEERTLQHNGAASQYANFLTSQLIVSEQATSEEAGRPGGELRFSLLAS